MAMRSSPDSKSKTTPPASSFASRSGEGASRRELSEGESGFGGRDQKGGDRHPHEPEQRGGTDGRREREPPGRFLAVHHEGEPPFDILFVQAEGGGERRGGAHSPHRAEDRAAVAAPFVRVDRPREAFVAGGLAERVDPVQGEPCERIEPVDDAGRQPRELIEEVPALQMGQFMQQDKAQRVRVCGRVGEQERGAAGAPRASACRRGGTAPDGRRGGNAEAPPCTRRRERVSHGPRRGGSSAAGRGGTGGPPTRAAKASAAAPARPRERGQFPPGKRRGCRRGFRGGRGRAPPRSAPRQRRGRSPPIRRRGRGRGRAA